MSTTLLSLDDKLAKMISSGGSYIEFDSSTNVTTNNSIISTTLQNYDRSRDDHFNHWWVYITEGNNIGKEREVSAYLTASGTLQVEGAALAAESAAVTCRLYKYRRADAVQAIKDAIAETFPYIHRRVDDRTLITGNHLPDGHFEDWTSATALRFYTASNVTLAKTTTAGLYRGARATTSAKATASAANGYFYISSDSYPRLLDLMDRTVDLKCWAYPEVANDAYIVIYTIQADGTEQTLTSTTTCPAGQWTLLELEDQELNDDIVEIQFRFKVATNTKYAYFDNARVNGKTIKEYLLPDAFQKGHIARVYVQSGGYSDDACDDILPTNWVEDFNHPIIDDGTYKYLYLPYYAQNKIIRLEGYAPLETLSADTDTISIDEERHLRLLLSYAAFSFYEKQEGVVSSDDVSKEQTMAGRWFYKYKQMLPKSRMVTPSTSMRFK